MNKRKRKNFKNTGFITGDIKIYEVNGWSGKKMPGRREHVKILRKKENENIWISFVHLFQ